MTDCVAFLEEVCNDSSEFVEHARNIGRAYRNQAMELIDICQSLSQIAPAVSIHEYVELRSVLRVCDLALRSATESGKKETNEANDRFKEATQVLRGYENLNGSCVGVSARMEKAKRKDNDKNGRPLTKPESNWMSIDFVILPFPALVALHDPRTIIVRQVLNATPSLPEILWNFSRYQERGRVTLEQNPHFYSSLPEDEGAYTSMFKCQPLGDFSTSLKPHDTVYVLVDRPSHVFLETVPEKRSFGNIWMLNGCPIFKDSTGVLEGEQLIRTLNIRGSLRYCERPAVFPNSEPRSRLNHNCLRPIIIPSADLTLGSPFKDWTVLSRPASYTNNIHIYDTQWASGSSNNLDPFPLPPTSEQPGYRLLYTNIKTLNLDILLSIFNYYRIDDEENWNVRLGWCKLSHVCRRWRHLIYGSVFYLNTHLLCTNGSPVLDMLAQLPPLPLVIDYQYTTTAVGALDGPGISHALQLRDRIRRVVLHIPSSILDKLLVLMDEPFPILENLSISTTAEGNNLTLPETFLSPNLRHLTLSGISLPGELTLLSTVSLVTLTLTNIASGYFLPKQLVAHLQSFSQLEELSIGFSIPLPRPSAEGELLDMLDVPVTLPILRHLAFRGVSAYLESLVAQMRAPLLQQLDISLFNQVVFELPRLSDFTNATQGLKLPIAKVIFKHDAVSVVMDRMQQPGSGPSNFSLCVICKNFDWQIDAAAQICGSLVPALSGVERLTLDFDGERIADEWQDGAVDGTTWRELLAPFIGARELHICRALTWELSSALQLEDIGLDPGLLPNLQELAPDIEEEQVVNAFASFVDICQVAGRTLCLRPRPQNLRTSTSNFESIFDEALNAYQKIVNRDLAVHPLASRCLPICFSAAVLPVLQDQVHQFEQSRSGVVDTDETEVPHLVESTDIVGTRRPHSVRTGSSALFHPPPPQPPKRIRGRIRPSHRGAGPVWR